jgi:hypothetical protein
MQKAEKIRTPYGSYTVKSGMPDRSLFRLRYEVLIRHGGFKALCLRHDSEDLVINVLAAWMNLDSWLDIHANDHLMICLLLYGNIHKQTFEQSWTWFKNAYNNYTTTRRSFPCYELKPGMVAEQNRLTFSVDPSLTRREAVRMFERFLTLKRKPVSKVTKDPLARYFTITEKRHEPNVVIRYMTVYDFRQKHPGGWRDRAANKFKSVYPVNTQSRRRTLVRDLQKAYNIIEWAIRGRFPCSKPVH